MKDKLTKHHRQTKFFRLRKFLIISFVVIALLAVVAIPLGITIAQMHV